MLNLATLSAPLGSRWLCVLQPSGPRFRQQEGGGLKKGLAPFKDTSWKSVPKLLLTSHRPHMAFSEAGKYGFYSGQPWAQLAIRAPVSRKMDSRGQLSVCHSWDFNATGMAFKSWGLVTPMSRCFSISRKKGCVFHAALLKSFR